MGGKFAEIRMRDGCSRGKRGRIIMHHIYLMAETHNALHFTSSLADAWVKNNPWISASHLLGKKIPYGNHFYITFTWKGNSTEQALYASHLHDNKILANTCFLHHIYMIKSLKIIACLYTTFTWNQSGFLSVHHI